MDANSGDAMALMLTDLMQVAAMQSVVMLLALLPLSAMLMALVPSAVMLGVNARSVDASGGDAPPTQLFDLGSELMVCCVAPTHPAVTNAHH